MTGLARVHEVCWRTCRGESGGQLLCHVPALAYARDDDTALGGSQQRDRLAEACAQRLLERDPQGLQTIAFDVERAHGRTESRRWARDTGFHDTQLPLAFGGH